MRGEVQPPTGEVTDRCVREEMLKPFGKDGPRNPDLSSECGDGPGLGRPLMQERQRFAHLRIANSGQPSGLGVRQLRDITSQRFHEQCFG